MRAVVITTDPKEPIRIEEINEDIESLYKAVGSDFQVIGLHGLNALMILAEDGKLIGFEPNRRASSLAWWVQSISGDDYIAGNALIVGRYTQFGEMSDLSDASITLINELLEELPEETANTDSAGAS